MKMTTPRGIYPPHLIKSDFSNMHANNSKQKYRVREINFDLMKTRENIPVLEKKLNAIEELLASRDAIGLERTLLENHVTRYY